MEVPLRGTIMAVLTETRTVSQQQVVNVTTPPGIYAFAVGMPTCTRVTDFQWEGSP
ncbi:MAG TPA: hypothetical protein VK447_03860 [Myxococcaceae bacterium]|nr:hypothetical protein [Myxococcaceae bacterium]